MARRARPAAFAGASWAEVAAKLRAPSAEAVKMECVLKILPGIAAAMQRASAERTESPE